MAATIGKGYALSINSTTIGAIEELKYGNDTQQTIEVQTNDSADLYGYKILGWSAVSDWEVTVIYTAAIATTLAGLKGAFHTCVFTRPDTTTTATFQGAIVEIGNAVPLKDKQLLTFKLAVSGSLS